MNKTLVFLYLLFVMFLFRSACVYISPPKILSELNLKKNLIAVKLETYPDISPAPGFESSSARDEAGGHGDDDGQQQGSEAGGRHQCTLPRQLLRNKVNNCHLRKRVFCLSVCGVYMCIIKGSASQGGRRSGY
jgi:hypothetical protein